MGIACLVELSFTCSFSQEDDATDILRELKQKVRRKLRHGKELTDVSRHYFTQFAFLNFPQSCCQIFDRLDTNGSGKISLDELQEGMEQFG